MRGHSVVRAAAWLYAAALTGWLLIGLVPLAARDIPPLHRWITARALGSGYGPRLAQRIVHPDMQAMPSASAVETLVQYGFSALNLALGLMLLTRVRGLRVPALLVFATLGTAATFNLPSHVTFHLIGSPPPVKLAHFTFHIVSGVTYLWAVALFPDGGLPRRLAGLGRAPFVAITTVVTAVTAYVSWRGSFLAHPQFFVVYFGIAVPAVGVLAQLSRITDTRLPIAERAVCRMLLAALLPALATAVLWTGARVAGAHQVAERAQSWFPAAFAVVPVVLCACVARYRLWDVDRLLSRLLAYVMIVVVAGAGYVVVLAVLAPLVGGGVWTTAVTLAVVATVCAPVADVVRSWANRVVFGQSLSPAEAARRLADGLERLAPSAEVDRIVDVAVRATRADRVELWLIDGERSVLAAAAGPAHRTGAGDGRWARDARLWPVQHGGDLHGHLAVYPPAGTALTRDDELLLGDIAAQAGLAVENARLGLVLAARVEELERRSEHLRAARRRLVRVHDEQRQAMETDLHDGAQQALIAAVVGIRGAQADPTPEAIRELVAVMDVAASSLAEIVDGVPDVVSTRGLAGALEQSAALARRTGITVEVRVDRAVAQTVTLDIQAAVYYACAEALQNVAKHARAHRVDIAVERASGEVRFCVADDGVGFDPSTATGTGLPRLGDRLATLAGWLLVESEPTRGTTLRGGVELAATS